MSPSNVGALDLSSVSVFTHLVSFNLGRHHTASNSSLKIQYMQSLKHEQIWAMSNDLFHAFDITVTE